MRKSHYSEEQIIGILRLAEAGQSVAEVCRQHGISEGTYYRWKAQYGGLEVSQLRRLRQLEDENRRLKQIVADLTLDNTALKDIAAKSVMTRAPASRMKMRREGRTRGGDPAILQTGRRERGRYQFGAKSSLTKSCTPGCAQERALLPWLS
jgi:putative transposase